MDVLQRDALLSGRRWGVDEPGGGSLRWTGGWGTQRPSEHTRIVGLLAASLTVAQSAAMLLHNPLPFIGIVYALKRWTLCFTVRLRNSSTTLPTFTRPIITAPPPASTPRRLHSRNLGLIMWYKLVGRKRTFLRHIDTSSFFVDEIVFVPK